MNLQNVIKEWFTTLLGCVIMGLALYGWWEDHLTDIQAPIFGAVGFVLLFMKDNLKGYIDSFTKKKIDQQ